MANLVVLKVQIGLITASLVFSEYVTLTNHRKFLMLQSNINQVFGWILVLIFIQLYPEGQVFISGILWTS